MSTTGYLSAAMMFATLCAAVLLLPGCKRHVLSSPQKQQPPASSLSLLKTKLEDRARGAEHHLCGHEAAERLRSVVRKLDRGGVGAFSGDCEVFCAFFVLKSADVPPDVSEIAVEAITSSSFKYNAVELVDSSGRVVCEASPIPLQGSVVRDIPGIQELGVRFFVTRSDGPGRTATTQESIGGEPVVTLAQPIGDLKAGLRSVDGKRSNFVPILEVPPLLEKPVRATSRRSD